MKRRRVLSGVGAGMALLAGCSGSKGNPTGQVTVPSLTVVNHEPRTVTVTVILTDASDEIHLWRTVELDARDSEAEGGSVDVHEFAAEWVDPRDYQLLIKWREGNETYSGRVADLRTVDDCAPLIIKIADGIQFSVTIESCPTPE